MLKEQQHEARTCLALVFGVGEVWDEPLDGRKGPLQALWIHRYGGSHGKLLCRGLRGSAGFGCSLVLAVAAQGALSPAAAAAAAAAAAGASVPVDAPNAEYCC